MTPAELIRSIKPRSRVTILVPAGRGMNGQEWSERTGTAVICNGDTVALNMGGPHGTPGVATDRNIVRRGQTRPVYTEDAPRCDGFVG